MDTPVDKIIWIGLDDVIAALKYRVTSETLGKIEDELKRDIPNLLKDESLKVSYDPNSGNHHLIIQSPRHEIKVVRITEEKI